MEVISIIISLLAFGLSVTNLVLNFSEKLDIYSIVSDNEFIIYIRNIGYKYVKINRILSGGREFEKQYGYNLPYILLPNESLKIYKTNNKSIAVLACGQDIEFEVFYSLFGSIPWHMKLVQHLKYRNPMKSFI